MTKALEYGIGKYQTEQETGGQSVSIRTGQLPEESHTWSQLTQVTTYVCIVTNLDLKIKNALPGMKGQKRKGHYQ